MIGKLIVNCILVLLTIILFMIATRIVIMYFGL